MGTTHRLSGSISPPPLHRRIHAILVIRQMGRLLRGKGVPCDMGGNDPFVTPLPSRVFRQFSSSSMTIAPSGIPKAETRDRPGRSKVKMPSCLAQAYGVPRLLLPAYAVCIQALFGRDVNPDTAGKH